MKTSILCAAAVGLVNVATLGIAGSMNTEQATTVASASVSEARLLQDIRIKTDEYLVPAHICADPEAEKYEDCVPFSDVAENVLVIFRSAK